MNADEPTTILKRDAVGRVSMPKEKREALLDEFERSSLKRNLEVRRQGSCCITSAQSPDLDQRRKCP